MLQALAAIFGVIAIGYCAFGSDSDQSMGPIPSGTKPVAQGSDGIGKCVANVNNGALIGRVVSVGIHPQNGEPTFATSPVVAGDISFPFVAQRIVKVIDCPSGSSEPASPDSAR